MDSKIFDRLQSSNPEDRKLGIKALVSSGEKEAIRYLTGIYHKDEDPKVRDMALKASRHIQNQLRKH